MSEARASLACSVAGLLLLAWLVVSHGLERAAPSAPDGDAAEFQRLREELRRIEGKLEELSAALTRTAELGTAVATQSRQPVAQPPALADQVKAVQDQLTTMQFAIQSLADGLADAEEGHQSHNLDEIHRMHPTTNWDACYALIQRSLAEPGAAEWSHLDDERSSALHDLIMQRPEHLLERFGAPSLTRIEGHRFAWQYHSPTAGADGRPELCLEITFDKGYVWDVLLRLP